MSKFSFVIAVFCWFVCAFAFAGTTGTLQGVVIDKDSKDPLIGVSVLVVGTMQGAATDAEGNFQVNNLEAGTYDIRFSNIGYQSLVYKQVVIRSDLRTKISVALVQSAVELSEMEITAERPLIEKDVTSTSYSVGTSQVDKLPVRDVQDLITMFPSVTAEGNVRGGKSTDVVYLVDGMPLQDMVTGGMGSTLPKSAITEFSLQSGGFDAEYGNALSGVVNIITRHGSDKTSLVARVEKDDWLGTTIDQQANRETEAELTLSGPIIAERLHYFSANTFQWSDTRWWQDFDRFFSSPISTDYSGMEKLDYTASSKMRLTFEELYDLKQWHDYQYSWRFDLDGLPPEKRTSFRTTAMLSHTISDEVHYTASLSEYYLRSQLGDMKSDINLTPYQYDIYLQYILSGSEAYWGDTRQNIYTAKTDWVIQPNPHNVIKFGLEFNQYNVFSDEVKYDPQTTYFGQVLPDLPMLNYSDTYQYYPRTGSAYFQEKLEVEKDGAVVNLGARWDFLDPRAERPVVEYVTPDSSKGQYQSQITQYVGSSFKQQVSPRIGLSFPLAWNMLLVMNYGHYFQFPLFDYLYSGINPQELKNGVSVLVGNPDLQPERTEAWEIGVKYGLDARTLLSVTYFKKNFINEIDSKTFLPTGGTLAGDYGFAEYVNNAYADAEGLEFVLMRTHDDFLTGSISYSLMRTEGVSDYVNQNINLQQWGFPVLNEPYPLSWDQLHTLKVSVDAVLPYDIVCNFIWTFNSGRPYTYYPTKNGYTPVDSTVPFLPNNARLPSNSLVNMKVSKKFAFNGTSSLSLYANIQNLFNVLNAKWADANGRIGGLLGDPSAYYDPRRILVGVRYEM